MRVLHVLNELKPSGAEVMLRVAAPHWEKLGIYADILSKGQDVGPFADALQKSGYKIIHIPFNNVTDFCRSFYHLLVLNNYDVVHIHTEHANFCIGLVAKLAKVKRVIRTVHSVFSSRGYIRLNIKVKRTILSWIGVKHVSIGPSVETNEKENFKNKTILIPNWYDSIRFVVPTNEERLSARQQLEVKDNDFAIVTVGNCSAIKNHAALFEALTILNSEPNIIYLHVGQENQENNERILAHQLGLADRVIFIGALENIAPVLYASDLYVMPSLHEGFGISALEALATGLPAILADVPGLRDFKSVFPDVYLTSLEPNSIASSIEQVLLLSKESRQAIGKATSYEVYNRFRIEVGADAYFALYSKP